jgi:hypothetical protein
MDWHFWNKWNVKTISSPEVSQHSADDQYVPEERTSVPKRFNQQELNDLDRELSLSKDKTELLASKIKSFTERCQSFRLPNKE